jgi:ATP-dependent exoDNAse (exonuclease V) beta subunit
MNRAAQMQADTEARSVALDPAESYIVQAPAGSGKTELLIQRYLRLLACVGEPEEILAVTFTRKAAGEMRARVIEALRLAESGQPPAQPHLLRSYELARIVMQDEQRNHWQLHRHPARLAISTIDAVNAWLAGRAPLTAGNTALHQVTDQPARLYLEAARATLEMLGEEGPAADRVAELLVHLDNDAERFERLIALMLPRREQWLRHIPPGEHRSRAALEAPLRELCQGLLRRLDAALPARARAELPALLAGAADQLAASDPESPLLAWRNRAGMAAPVTTELHRWRALADVLLTTKGEWRQTLNRQQGFPPNSAGKQQLLALLTAIRDTPGLLHALDDVRRLAEPAYGEGQWAVLRALLDVLPLAAAQLRLVSDARGQVDFAQVATDALSALGSGEHTSELGLALDNRVRHILVDEFQDTSSAQFDLLAALVDGWQPGDGRTLFLVGDPMQSIYRFREAEVRLFMRVRDQGLGAVRPRFLRLQANFRSDQCLITWINDTFGATFPSSDDMTLGAVGFAPSLAALAPDPNAELRVRWACAGHAMRDAQQIAELVGECRRRWPEEKLGILVRSRAHAAEIIRALRAGGIAFVAPDLETLDQSPVALDLLALTRALSHAGDRLAWLAVLRAPWCGLSLADLEQLAGADHKRPLWERMNDPANLAGISSNGRTRLDRLRNGLAPVFDLKGRRSLRDLVEGAWLALGGPATVVDTAEIQAADAFLDQLEAVDDGGDCADVESFSNELAGRHATLAGGNPLVQIMTIHKAKGLEFDTVILPGLARAPRGDDRPILLWHEVAMQRGGSASVLAPAGRAGAERDELYETLWRIERQKETLEQDRLLYVACTRARRRLYLFSTLNVRDDGAGSVELQEPRRGSLLARLWPVLEADARRAVANGLAATPGSRGPHWVEPLIHRVAADWRAPPAPPGWSLRLAEEHSAQEPIEYQWANRWAMHVGSVVHSWLQKIAEEGVERFDDHRIDALAPVFRRMLARLGTPGRDLDQATARVSRALRTAAAGPHGRWVLSNQHEAAAAELPLTLWDGTSFRQMVIDRTFIDTAGWRWVIDYKTSVHEGGDLDGFLRAEADRHREQLRRYRDVLLLRGEQRVRTGLYFPLLEVFHEVTVD